MITNFDHTSKLSNKFLPAHQSPLPHHTQSQKISNILLLYDDGIEAIRYSFHSHSCQTLTSSHHALPFPYNKSPRMMQFLEVDKNHRLIFLITLSLFVHQKQNSRNESRCMTTGLKRSYKFYVILSIAKSRIEQKQTRNSPKPKTW